MPRAPDRARGGTRFRQRCPRSAQLKLVPAVEQLAAAGTTQCCPRRASQPEGHEGRRTKDARECASRCSGLLQHDGEEARGARLSAGPLSPTDRRRRPGGPPDPAAPWAPSSTGARSASGWGALAPSRSWPTGHSPACRPSRRRTGATLMACAVPRGAGGLERSSRPARTTPAVVDAIAAFRAGDGHSTARGCHRRQGRDGQRGRGGRSVDRRLLARERGPIFVLERRGAPSRRAATTSTAGVKSRASTAARTRGPGSQSAIATS